MTAIDHVFPFPQGKELAHTHQLTGLLFVFYHFLFGFFCFVSATCVCKD